MKVKIGIAGNYLRVDAQNEFGGAERCYVNRDYVDSLLDAGAVPVILPPMVEDVDTLLDGLDGLVLSGGYDVDPKLYGQDTKPTCGYTDRSVDLFYLAIIKEAEKRNLPVFGICKGIQAMNVAYGGTLHQDINSEVEGSLQHVQSAKRCFGTHDIQIEPGSFLYEVFGDTIRVNSYHHQSVADVAQGFKVCARANDGIVECIEKEEGSFMVAVQFHPEMMAAFQDEDMQKLFRAFVKVCHDQSGIL